MKKLFALVLAALTFFTVFAFAGCASRAEEIIDEIVESLKNFDYASITSDGTIKITEKTKEDQLWTLTGERLSFSDNTSETEVILNEKVDMVSGDSDIFEKQSDGVRNYFKYNFIRGKHAFLCTQNNEVTNFTGLTMHLSDEYVTDSSDESVMNVSELLETLYSAVFSIAKSTGAISVKGGKLIVNLNAMMYGIISDLNSVFDDIDGNITLGKVFANEKIKGYFTPEIYDNLGKVLSSYEVYKAVYDIIDGFAGELISLPKEGTLANIDISLFAKQFKTITEKVTKKKFLFSLDDKNKKTTGDYSITVEWKLSLSLSNAKLVFTVQNGKISEQTASASIGLDTYVKTECEVFNEQSKSYENEKTESVVCGINEAVKFSNEKCELADISKAYLEYEEYEIPNEKQNEFVHLNPKLSGFYSSLSSGGLAFTFNVYLDSYGDVVDVVAESSGYNSVICSYNDADKSLTLSGGKFDEPFTVYLNFYKRTGSAGQMFGIEIYSTAADRDARRMCAIGGECPINSPNSDGDRKYYQITARLWLPPFKYIDYAVVQFKDQKITDLYFREGASILESEYDAADGKITVTMCEYNSEDITAVYYVGIFSDDGEDGVKIGLYKVENDAKIGSDCYDFYFRAYRAAATKIAKIEDYLLKINKGDLT